MDSQAFIINNNFLVEPSLGLVIRQESGEKIRLETRLEPRLMQLLSLLAASDGGMVTRADLMQQVWDNYGNAGDGLTQGICYLRRVLGDEDKTLIETIPKKGYVFHGAVTRPIRKAPATPAAAPAASPVKQSRRRRFGLVMVAVVGLLSALGGTGYLISRSSSASAYHGAGGNHPDLVPASADGRTPSMAEEKRETGKADIRPDAPSKNSN
jgi:DNA-binding winged helix-turn-helix (wHTH) protein